MSRSGWKEAERRAAAIIGGQRWPANMGGAVDVESATTVAQVKEVGRLSLAQLEALALEAERQGMQRAKAGLLLVKRSAGHGRRTPWLVVMTEATYREMNGPVQEAPPHAAD